MRTTIEIAAPLLEEARRLAMEGVDLRILIEDGLRTIVAARSARENFRLNDAGFSGNGVQAGVEEGRWFQIRDLARGCDRTTCSVFEGD